MSDDKASQLLDEAIEAWRRDIDQEPYIKPDPTT